MSRSVILILLGIAALACCSCTATIETGQEIERREAGQRNR